MHIVKEVVEKFVNWTKLKIKIHISGRAVYPRERQIWWVSLGQNVGVEINGKNDRFERPVLVLKKFNDDACLILPLSSKIKVGSFYFEFKNSSGGVSVVNFSQVRSVSAKRFIRKIEKMSVEDFVKVKNIFKQLL